VAVSKWSDLPPDKAERFKDSAGECAALDRFIWIRSTDDSLQLLATFWHEIGHYIDEYESDWLTEFINNYDSGEDWNTILASYPPEQHEAERRAWLFSFKVRELRNTSK
jgi:hypothetical protein